jgi:hypothetical protein
MIENPQLLAAFYSGILGRDVNKPETIWRKDQRAGRLHHSVNGILAWRIVWAELKVEWQLFPHPEL